MGIERTPRKVEQPMSYKTPWAPTPQTPTAPEPWQNPEQLQQPVTQPPGVIPSEQEQFMKFLEFQRMMQSQGSPYHNTIVQQVPQIPAAPEPTASAVVVATAPAASMVKFDKAMKIIGGLILAVIWSYIAIRVYVRVNQWNNPPAPIVVPDDNKPDPKPVDPKPDVVVDHEVSAAVELAKLHASDWQAKMEVLRECSQMTFNGPADRQKWINEQLAARFKSSNGAFLDEFSYVLLNNQEKRMSEIMAASKVTYDLSDTVSRLEAAGKKIKPQ